MNLSNWTTVCLALLVGVRAFGAEAEKPADANPSGGTNAEVAPGHSYHGEFLNEGPRHKAYLMGGTGHVRFPVTTTNELVQKFIEQGIGQLYGFWYLEAERSFRQAAALDPDCAMAYWGAALATLRNEKRCKGFIGEAVKRKDKASDRERLYIEALDAYVKAGTSKKKERAQKYTAALEDIALKYPDDIEARAFLALQLYLNRSAGVPITSYLAVNALLKQIFAAQPMHSAHHFLIHLWDYKKPERALHSASVCGQSSPAIAHMWHMPGHIYSRLKRYEDACWQQEASARVDHAHMMRDHVLPDQIHNFAHNNEWLIRNLNHVGRVRDAVELAKNMIELPQHPRFNTLQKTGSARYGRQRLLQTLTRYELWEELIALCDTPYIEPTDDDSRQVERLRHLGMAYLRKGDIENGLAQLGDLNKRLDTEKQARDKAVAEAETKAQNDAVDMKLVEQAVRDAEKKAKEAKSDEQQIEQAKSAAADKSRADQLKKKEKEIDKAKKDAAKPFESKIGDLEKAISELEGHQAVAKGDFKAAMELLKKAGGVDPMYLALVQHLAGETDKALDAARKYVDRNKNEVHPLAMLVELLWKADKKDDAKKAFEQLREISSSIDLGSPVFDRLRPMAAEFGYSEDWRQARKTRDDVGERPDLDSLGPFRWQPSPAPAWTLQDAEGKPHSLKDFAGKPVVVIFYLGFECLHCAEQLQAFAPITDKFNAAGIQLIAISTDEQDGLRRSIENYDKGKMPIPLVSDSKLDVFKDYHAFDDFEQQALHGTFLVGPKGEILWQDIGYEPFMEPKFLLKESQRLLAQRSAE